MTKRKASTTMTTESDDEQELTEETWDGRERRKNRGRPILSRGPIILTLEALSALTGIIAILALIFSFAAQGAYNIKTKELAKQAKTIAINLEKTVIENRKIANKARQLGVEIQQQRAKSVRELCEDQNARNRNTIMRLHILMKQYLDRHPNLTSTKIKTLKINYESSALLINALAPHRDCDKLVAIALGKGAR
jgi:hypothetical protein